MFKSNGLLVTTIKPTAEYTSCIHIVSFYILPKNYRSISWIFSKDLLMYISSEL
jgi:hypothetical protein